MEFQFDINELFKQPITKITKNLYPPGFMTSDRREAIECQTKIADIINAIGEASAAAQGLTKPITTADRLRTSDHTLYILVDATAGRNGKGCVTGMLKVGRKGLYVFDPSGGSHQLKPVCVLDFYVHESRQRAGLGRRLFEYMLKEEDIEPVRLAIDRPSEKFLAFLKKHYGLTHVVPQMNNFVVFEGFFVPAEEEKATTPNRIQNSHNNNSIISPRENGIKQKPTNGSQYTPPYGRYGAPKPPCSMGEIIHSYTSKLGSTESSGEEPPAPAMKSTIIDAVSNSPKRERPRSLSIKSIDEQLETLQVNLDNISTKVENDNIPEETVIVKSNVPFTETSNTTNVGIQSKNSNVENDELENTTINTMSMISSVITPKSTTPAKTPSNLTEQGFLDLKFYHSKLW